MKINKRIIISVAVIFVLIITGVLFVHFLCRNEKINTASADPSEPKTIILSLLSNNSGWENEDSHLSDKEFTIIQDFVKEHEEELKDYDPLSINDEYSIFIDRESRALFAKNTKDMTRRLTWRTIDCNDYSTYDTFICKNDRTYCIGKNIIAEFYLGNKIAEFEVPFEKPTILAYYMDDVVVAEGDFENSTLMLCTQEKCIPISNYFSGLPVEIHINGLYYIENDMTLHMYNLCTGKTTFISDDTYELFYSSGINFKSKDGIYRVNLYVSGDGSECIKNIKSEKTDLVFEKWKE